MRFRLAGVIALSLLASIATAFARVPQGAPPPPLVTTGLIVGRVVDAGTGRPVAGVVVTLNGGAARGVPQAPQPVPATGRAASFPAQPPRILTDGDGRFAFRNLTRGSYTIAATKTGFSAGSFGRNRPEGPARSLQLDDNERVADAVIKVFKLASITGRITDEVGEPIVAAQVRVYRRMLVSGRRRFRDYGSTQTDDRGVYRFGNLVPGDYVVAAPLSSITAPAGRPAPGFENNYSLSASMTVGGPPSAGGAGRPIGSDGRFVLQSDNTAVTLDASGKWRGYATQYYPASRTIASAEVLALPSGEERLGVDIQMRYVPVSSISGTLSTPDNSAANFVLRLISADVENMAAEPESASTMTDGTGAFYFAGIPSGQYVIQAMRVSREPLQFLEFTPAGQGAGRSGFTSQVIDGPENRRPPPPMLWASVPVNVGDSDVNGVRVLMQEGFSVSGRFEFTGSRPKPDAQRLAQIPVVVEPADGRENFEQGTPSRSNADGRFITASKSPGKYILRVGGAPAGFVVQSIMVNGVNAMEMPFDLSGNVTNAIVTFTDQVSSLTVAVRGLDPADDPAMVVLFPADSRAWKDYGINPARMRTARALPAGTVNFGSILAGDYLAAALPDEFSTEWQDPAYLELVARTAERVTLGQGEKRSITIEVTGAKPPSIKTTSGVVFDQMTTEVLPRSFSDSEQPDGSSAAATWQQAPVRDTRAESPVGAGSISGTVTIDDGSVRPARLARVRLTGSGAAFEKTALTDEAGRYTIPSLPAGDYTIVVTKPSFLQMFYGGKRPTIGPGSTVKVAVGQAVTNIDVTLLKGAVIAGTVFDDMGQPAPGVRVQLMTFTRREGERLLTNAQGATSSSVTNDRGEYRFYGLRPAKYVVMATLSSTVVNQELRQLTDGELRAAIADASRSPVAASVLYTPRTIAPAPTGDAPPAQPPPGRAVAYSPTYYPGTSRDEEAGELTASAGQELSNINIPLRYVTASRVEGKVIGHDGQVATNAQVQLLKFSGTGMGSSGLRSQAGNFQATGVAAGHYVLIASSEASGRGRGAGQPSGVTYAQLPLDLNGDDRLNIVLQLAPLPTITGRVAFDGAPAPGAGAVQVMVEPAGSGLMNTIREARPATTDENGVFTITDVMPGRYRLNARVIARPNAMPPSPQPTPPGQSAAPNSAIGAMNATGWTMASARVAGQEAFVSAFEVAAGQALTDAEVTLTNRPSDISGKLIDSSNKPALNLTVVLFPVDRALWITNAPRVNRISRPNSTGTFSFPLAVPGEYYLCVLSELDALDWTEPDFKEQLVPAAIKITVAKGEKKVQDFKIARPLFFPSGSPAR